MKYINRLFAFDDRQEAAQIRLSTKLTSTLYSVIFEPDQFNFIPQEEKAADEEEDEDDATSSSSITSTSSSWSKCQADEKRVDSSGSIDCSACHSVAYNQAVDSVSIVTARQLEPSAQPPVPLATRYYNHNYQATIERPVNFGTNDCTTTTTTSVPRVEQSDDNNDHEDEDDDWILLGESSKPTNSSAKIDAGAARTADESHCCRSSKGSRDRQSQERRVLRDIGTRRSNNVKLAEISETRGRRRRAGKRDYYLDEQSIEELRQMALDANDLELIKASWLPVRKDPVGAGVLLFKGLFTKFPQYIDFFPQFSDLDLERMQENKRLLRHAAKVLDTVGFLVDSIGDESKTQQLNEALNNLVESHLRRKIGLTEFRNLGIVLIDFICDVNHRRDTILLTSTSCSKEASASWSKAPASSSSSSLLPASSVASASVSNNSNDSRAGIGSDKSMIADDGIGSGINDEVVGGNNGSSNDNNVAAAVVGGGSVDDYKATSAAAAAVSGGAPSTNKYQGDDGDLGPSAREANQSQDKTAAATTTTRIDTSGLVAAWTKLYGSILDLVKRLQNDAS